MASPSPIDPDGAALVLIDLQRAIDDPRWQTHGPRNNPGAEAVAARLLAAWRAAGRPVFHIRHDSRFPESAYRPGSPGHAFKPEAEPLPGETVLGKQTNSAFAGTDLEARLRALGVGRFALAGVLTHNSLEATARAGGDLGFEVLVVEDACFAVGVQDRTGRVHDAETVHQLALANLDGEYARVVTSAQLLA